MHLLLVEDDEALGALAQRGLEASGYHVDWERDGAEAYDRASSGAYDALVLDLMLPGLDGLELLKALREAGVLTPVLCLTARSSLGDRVSGLDAGADDYLTKPFAFEELLARIRALLRRPTDLLIPDALNCGSLRLWPTDRVVAVDGRPVDVPPREFALLEYLLRHAGRTLSRDTIADRIWGPETIPETNVVDVTVSRLRRRLRRVGWNGEIVAIPRMGYRLAAPDAEVSR